MKSAEATVASEERRIADIPAQESRDQVQQRRLIFVNRFFYPDVSATSQMLTDLAQGLASERFERHVICSRQLYEDARVQLAARDNWRAVVVHRCWSTSFGRTRLLGRALDYVSFYLSATLELLRHCHRDDVI